MRCTRVSVACPSPSAAGSVGAPGVAAQQVRTSTPHHPHPLAAGYCSTNMSSFRGPQPASDGADTPLWLAYLPQEQWVTGKFFTDRKEEPF